jgi:rhodanese-related sulfurtransferase
MAVQTITREELKDKMDRGDAFVLVDVLSRGSYEKEHIKGAISLPEKETEQPAEQILDRDDEIITYCASARCKASTRVAEKLQEKAFTRVLEYKGGIRHWKNADLPTEGRIA